MNKKPKKRTITPAIYQQALAIVTMASGLIARADEFEWELSRLLGYPDRYMGHISDVLGSGRIDLATFDRALDLEGLVVAPDPVIDAGKTMIEALDASDEARPIFNDAAETIRRLLAEIERLKVRP